MTSATAAVAYGTAYDVPVANRAPRTEAAIHTSDAGSGNIDMFTPCRPAIDTSVTVHGSDGNHVRIGSRIDALPVAPDCRQPQHDDPLIFQSHEHLLKNIVSRT